MSQGLIIADLRGRVVSMNRSALELHDVEGVEGFAPPEVFGQAFEALDSDGEPLPAERWPLVRAINGETVCDFEIRVTNRRTGRRWTGLYSATPVAGADGEPCLSVVTVEDVTAIRQAGEAAQAREARFRALVDGAPDLIARFDREQRLIYANGAAAKAFRLAAGRTEGALHEVFAATPALIEAFAGNVRLAFETGMPQRVEFEIESEHGARFYEAYLVAERDHRGEIRSVFSLSRDLTERRKGERDRESLLAEVRALAGRLEQVQAVTAALSAAVTSAEVAEIVLREVARAVPPVSNAIFVTETEGSEPGELRAIHSLGEWPPQLRERWFGFRREAFPPALRERLVAGEPILLEDLATLFARYPSSVEASLPQRMQALVLLPVAQEGRLVGVAGFSYAAPRRFSQAERELLNTLGRLSAQALVRARLYESERRLRAEAEEETRLRERLMAVLGHDLRQPMSVISAGVGTVLRRPEGVSERVLALLQRSARAIAGMDALLSLLLDYSRLRAGKPLPLALVGGDLGDWVQDSVADLRVAHPDRDLELECCGEMDGEWDRLRLGQVVGNLVLNALTHGGKAGPINVRVEGRGEEVLLEVANHGEPIPPESLDEIFEPFRQARGEHASSRGGMGLGLFIVREIARAHGGEVEVRSSREDGTVFTVRLPRKR